MRKSLLIMGLLAALLAAVIPTAAQEDTIVDILSASAQGQDAEFTMLLAALEAADLTDTLDSDGGYTLFAPTDEAFEQLIAALEVAADDLLGRYDLVQILNYHLVPAVLYEYDLREALGFGQRLLVETVNGASIVVRVVDDRITINEAEIVTTDIEASNGVIHIIDTVLMPSEASSGAMGPSNLITGEISLEVDGQTITIEINRAFVNFADVLREALDELDGEDISAADINGVVQIALPSGPAFTFSFGQQGIAFDLQGALPGVPEASAHEGDIGLSGVFSIRLGGEPVIIRLDEASADIEQILQTLVPGLNADINIDNISGELRVVFAEGSAYVVRLADGRISVEMIEEAEESP